MRKEVLHVREKYGAALLALLFLVFSSITIIYAADALDAGNPTGDLVAHYRFDEGAGQTVYDVSNNSNDGSVNGANWTDGRRGRGVALDGADDNVTVPQTLAGKSAFTVSLWANVTASSYSNDARVFSSGGSATSQVLLWTDNDNGNGWDFILWDGSSHARIDTNKTPTGWVHVVGVWDGSEMRLYVNGKQAGTQSFSGDGTVGDTGNDMVLGSDNGGSTQNLQGAIDDVRVYKTALNASDVKALYGGGSFSTGQEPDTASGKVLDVSFDRWNDTHVFDTSSGENHGKPQNGASQKGAVHCRVGRCYSFDGADERVDIGSDIDDDVGDSDAFTLMAWINWDGGNADTARDIIHIGGFSAVLSMQKESGTPGHAPFVSFTNNTGDLHTLVGPNPISTDTWVHVAGTYNNDTLRLYRDGVEVDTLQVGDAVETDAFANAIGARDTDARHFSGMIDQVKTFDHALSQQEIIEEAGIEKDGAVLDMRFDTGTGSTIHDTSMHGNDGTVGDGPEWTDGVQGDALHLPSGTATVPTSSSLTGALNRSGATIAFWVKPNQDSAGNWKNYLSWSVTNASGHDHTIVTETSNGGIDTLYTRWIAANANCGDSTGDGGFWSRSGTDMGINPHQWNLYVATYDGTTSKEYVNGKLRESSVENCKLANMTGDISLHSGVDHDIDTFRIYPYAISADKVTELYNRGSARTGSSERQEQDPVSKDEEQDDLVLHHRFTEGNDTHVFDRSGSVNHGTLENDPVEQNAGNCVTGRCMQFDGEDDYITVPDDSSLDVQDGNWTFTAWVNQDRSRKEAIVAKQNSFWIYTATGGAEDKIAVEQGGGLGWSTVYSNSRIQSGQWHHVAVIHDDRDDTVRIYLDGVNDSTGTLNLQTSSNDINIGRWSDGNRNWTGKIDDVRIYNRTLKDNEIWHVYTEGRDRQSRGDMAGSAAWYRMDDHRVYTAGVVEDVNGWTTVNLDRSFDDPVVMATGQDGADRSMAVEASRPVIRNVQEDSFEVQVMNGTGDVVTEDVGYVVMEKGHHTVDGVEVEAGTYTVSAGNNLQTVSFDEAFPGDTAVADALQEECSGPTSSRYSEGTMGSSSYDVYWEDYNGSSENSWSCGTVTAGYIAVERGASTDQLASGMVQDCSADPDGGDWCTASFGATFDARPVLLVNPVESSGGDKTVMGRQALSTSDVNLRPTESKDPDSEQGHATNDLPWLVFTQPRVPDYSGEDNTGFLGNDSRDRGNDPNWTGDCTMNGCLDFDGMDDFVRTGVERNFEDSFSVSAWFNPDETPSDGQRLVADDDNNNGWALSYGDPGSGQLRFFVRGMDAVSLDTSSIIDAGTWYHVVGVFDADGNDRYIYVDGVREASDTADTGTPSTDAGNVTIGDEGVNGESKNFDGQLDDVRVYPYALSDEQVQQVMQQGSTRIG